MGWCKPRIRPEIRPHAAPITKAGDPVLRSLLIEASWTAIRTDPELATFYQRLYHRHAKDKAARVAIVAVARKLATRLHCVLQQRRVYRLKHLMDAPALDSSVSPTEERHCHWEGLDNF